MNSEWREVSEELTPEQKILGWPQGRLSAHTEAKAVTRVNLRAGQKMVITGVRPPCPSCRGIMKQVASLTGAAIWYEWHENNQVFRWIASIEPSSKNISE